MLGSQENSHQSITGMRNTLRTDNMNRSAFGALKSLFTGKRKTIPVEPRPVRIGAFGNVLVPEALLTTVFSFDSGNIFSRLCEWSRQANKTTEAMTAAAKGGQGLRAPRSELNSDRSGKSSNWTKGLTRPGRLTAVFLLDRAVSLRRRSLEMRGFRLPIP